MSFANLHYIIMFVLLFNKIAKSLRSHAFQNCYIETLHQRPTVPSILVININKCLKPELKLQIFPCGRRSADMN